MSDQASFMDDSPRHGRGNRGNRGSPTSEIEKQKQTEINSSFDDRLVSKDQSKIISKESDLSFFENQDSNDTNKKNKKPDTISEKSDQEEELDRDLSNAEKLDQSNWDIDDSTENKKNHKKLQQEPKNAPHGRGNRGGQQNEKQKQSSGSNLNPDHQLPSQQSGPKKRGNRDSQNRGGSNYEDIPYQRRFGNSNRDDEGSGGYGSYRGNREGGGRGGYRGGNRGGRGGRGGGLRANDRDYNNSDREEGNASSKFGESENQSTYKPNFSKKTHHYEDNNNWSSREGGNYRGGFNNDRGSFRRREPEVVQRIVEKIIEKEVVVEKQIIKYIEPPRPTGVRVQPSVSMFIKGCKLTLNCRRLQDFSADVLIIPYKTPKLQLYPGYFVNSCEVNYKQKIKEKGAKLLELGNLVYMQKSIGQNKYKAFAFLSVADAQNNIKKGIKEVFENLKKINSSPGNKFESVVFPICTELGQSKAVLETFVKEIENYHTVVKNVYVLTEQYKAFCDAVTKYNEIFLELFEENELS